MRTQPRQHRQQRAMERLTAGLTSAQLTEGMMATRRGEKPSQDKIEGKDRKSRHAREQRRAMVVVRTEQNLRAGV